MQKTTTEPKRYIPTGFVRYTPDLSPIGDYKKDLFAVYVHADHSRPQALFYTGKQKNHTWFYRFPTTEAMKNKINETISRLIAWEDMKIERKERKQTETASVKVGDLFSYSWGYDQTNVEFYQVTKVSGKTFTIREIASRAHGENPSGGMSDYVSPAPDKFIGPEILKRSPSMDHGVLSATAPDRKHFCSWYA